MPTIKVLPHVELCPEGKTFEARPGISLCTALLENGVPIEHACEQSLACTTCHVIVREGFEATGEMSEREEDLLDRAWGLTSVSRLSCQVRLHEAPLTIELPRYTINHARERQG
ncbi:MAG: ISC system 2Fe-2S type ferredoxin [Casimicrobiaceae bacterium]|nr:ISC system 2Fe-2S type ferredoxin [Casimicrobiaceae bacterium]